MRRHRGVDDARCRDDVRPRCPTLRTPGAGPARGAVPGLLRWAAAGRCRPRPGHRAGAGAARRGGRAGPGRGALGQRCADRRTAARGGRELLVLGAALPRHPRGSGLGAPPAPGALPAGPDRSRARVGGGPGRLRARPDGSAPAAAGVRRHAGEHLGPRLVGRRRERAARVGRADQRAGGHAVPARRLGAVVHLGGAAVHAAAVGAHGGRALLPRHGRRGRGHGQPLGPRRGGRGGRHGGRGRSGHHAGPDRAGSG